MRLTTTTIDRCCTLGLLGLLSLGLAGCSSAAATDGNPTDPALIEKIEQLRLATAPFHSFDVAQAAGWNAALSECVESPEGAMGVHYGKPEQLNDGGKLSLRQPEVLLYLPEADGSMAFIGVEYIIPEADWPHAEAPEFLGQALHFNPVQRIWALHVWVGRSNPEGLFKNWNPAVSCDTEEA